MITLANSFPQEEILFLQQGGVRIIHGKNMRQLEAFMIKTMKAATRGIKIRKNKVLRCAGSKETVYNVTGLRALIAHEMNKNLNLLHWIFWGENLRERMFWI